jgi:hypothetical protein
MTEMLEPVPALSDILINELRKALSLPPTRQIDQSIRLVFGRAADHFSALAVGLDRIVAERGVASGARWVLPRFVNGYAARGLENIPASGPLVIASNHPGSIDSVVIAACVTRPDFKIIIGDIPFFENLPHISEHAIYAPGRQDIVGRMRVVREAIRHLSSGGALLIFARGGIEPDPAFMPSPDAEFDLWSRSLQIFLERVPQTRILVTIVSGVISRLTMSHPITWLRRNRPDRQRLAFMLQMAQQVLSGQEKFGLVPHVSFGRLVSLNETGTPECALDQVIESARSLLRSHLIWQQETKYANI